MIKALVKKITPQVVLKTYHLCLAVFANIWYGRPSEKIIVIGVSGTKGKSTTANLIAQFLELTGHRVGLTSTATMKVDKQEWLSDLKMTMPGRFQLQKLLYEMVKTGCEYAVIETSSEGIEQFRNIGIHYDTVVLTNFTPEHIEAHGSYENYRKAKGKLFIQLKNASEKVINGKRIGKNIVINPAGGEYEFFSGFSAGEEWLFGLGDGQATEPAKNFSIKILERTGSGTKFVIRGREIFSKLLFEFNALNIIAAVAACAANGIDIEKILATISALKPVPGRQEFIDEGQNFKVMVDYTYEPTSMEALYKNLSIIKHQKIIHVLGPTGGGRDKWRRPVMGEIAAHNANIVIATTDDPYDDDPLKMIDEMLAGAEKVKKDGKAVELLKIIDRREAIRTALKRAEENDLVLITGKGAEQKMALSHGLYIPWDDRQVTREELRFL